MKINLENRVIHKEGQVQLSDSALLELVFKDPDILNDDICVIGSKNTEKYNEMAKLFDFKEFLEVPKDIEHLENQLKWDMPSKYLDINLKDFVLSNCTSKEEENRVLLELELFEERNADNLLRYLIYLVDTMRAHGIVWGVGRGSSVASHILFKIGLHKVNSLQYGLDPYEFFKS
jgi:DNA polymerase III alpha subunit